MASFTGVGANIVFALCSVACGAPAARLSTQFASDFKPANHTVSVFGVYKDGQMSSEAWDELRPRIEASFGGSRCEAAYREPVGSTNDPLPGAIGDYARTNGPTDDLLVQLAPAAQGDLILVLTVAGQLPVPAKVTVHDAPRRPAGKGRSASDADPNMLQLSASLFSVAQGHSVAVVDMKYTGSSARDAVEQFAARLSQSFPATVCRGWNWNVNIDPEPIRKLME